MKPLSVSLRRVGNSLGIVIPKPIVMQVGLEDHVELSVERGAIVLRKSAKAVRTGWATAAQAVAASGEDRLAMGEFGNQSDADLAW